MHERPHRTGVSNAQYPDGSRTTGRGPCKRCETTGPSLHELSSGDTHSISSLSDRLPGHCPWCACPAPSRHYLWPHGPTLRGARAPFREVPADPKEPVYALTGPPPRATQLENKCAAGFPGPVFRSRAPLCHIFLPSVALGIAAKRARTSGAGAALSGKRGIGTADPFYRHSGRPPARPGPQRRLQPSAAGPLSRGSGPTPPARPCRQRRRKPRANAASCQSPWRASADTCAATDATDPTTRSYGQCVPALPQALAYARDRDRGDLRYRE